MFRTLEIRPIPLTSPWFRRRAEEFLSGAGLSLDPGLDYLAGIYDADERLIGCGGLEGHTIKCLALSEETRGENLGATLVSHLYGIARERGAICVTLFTKPENLATFRSLGFHYIGQAPLAIMMQSSSKPLEDYKAYLRTLPRGSRNGVIVMNANPMTEGHLHLIRKGAEECDCLTVIPVADNPATQYPYATRREIMMRACADMSNVTIAEGSEYAVSASTFPSYFLKRKSDASPTHIALDLDIFARHIAPSLDATVRFVGSEPTDPLTAAYNKEMHNLLPASGIEVIEIERITKDDFPISASRLRKLTEEGALEAALELAVPAARPWILARQAACALRKELDLTPKPGLVDRHDSGSHKDMDHPLMARSIEALEPWFARFAEIAAALPFPEEREERTDKLRTAAIEAEKSMLEATGGINTHRGAIFAAGLMTAATAILISSGRPLTERRLREEISAMARLIPRAEGSHGARVAEGYYIPTALDIARGGYEALFSLWLPFYRRLKDDNEEEASLKTLLLIISTLQDSNAFYRGGGMIADLCMEEAKNLLKDFSLEGVSEMNRRFVERNVSHGGSADMLALTFLADSILRQEIESERKDAVH